MASMNKGLFGGFTGTIGGTVGYYIRGKQYVQSRPTKSNNPPSPLQIINRDKFSLVTKFMKPLCCFLNEVHKGHFKTMSGYNKMFSLNILEAVSGDYPDFAIDFRKLQLTKGSLPQPRNIRVSCAGPGFLVFDWKDDSGIGPAHSSDQLFVIAYNEETKIWEIFRDIGKRSEGLWITDMTRHRGNRLQTYTGFISADGRHVSNSQYTGMINVL